MLSTSFGDIDIAGSVALARRLSSSPGSPVYTAIFSRVPVSGFPTVRDSRGEQGAGRNRGRKTPRRGSSVQNAKRSRSKLRGCADRANARTAAIRGLLKALLQSAISALRILESLLNRGKILLRRRHVSSFQVSL